MNYRKFLFSAAFAVAIVCTMAFTKGADQPSSRYPTTGYYSLNGMCYGGTLDPNQMCDINNLGPVCTIDVPDHGELAAYSVRVTQFSCGRVYRRLH
jgi:hypothetical protein